MKTHTFVWLSIKFLGIRLLELLQLGFPKRNNTGKGNFLLLIKTDALGDYFLFRSLLPALRERAAAHDQKLLLVLNALCRPLYEAFDQQEGDVVIWLRPSSYLKKLPERLELLKKLQQYPCHDLLYFNTERTPFWDSLAYFSQAKRKWAYRSTEPFPGFFKAISDVHYQQVVGTAAPTRFAFSQMKQLAEEYIGRSLAVPLPSFKVEQGQSGMQTPKANIGCFPGAAESFRRWPAACFRDLGQRIHAAYGEKTVIFGSKADQGLAAAIVEGAADCFEDWTGRTSLPGLVHAIGQLQLLITNDTAALHIGAACGVPTIGISNGKHFGRFHPYPAGATVQMVYPPEVEQLRQNERAVVQRFDRPPYLPISSISVDRVWAIADQLLKSKR